ncbi:unnamed protein product [Caenorhabditis sp. 36 PRJEB53466]|nr:unnamed protein product [Caenorhabditis sp. 36 PRJEB53466]
MEQQYDPNPDFCIPRYRMNSFQNDFLGIRDQTDILIPLGFGLVMAVNRTDNRLLNWLMRIGAVATITTGLLRLAYFFLKSGFLNRFYISSNLLLVLAFNNRYFSINCFKRCNYIQCSAVNQVSWILVAGKMLDEVKNHNHNSNMPSKTTKKDTVSKNMSSRYTFLEPMNVRSKPHVPVIDTGRNKTAQYYPMTLSAKPQDGPSANPENINANTASSSASTNKIEWKWNPSSSMAGIKLFSTSMPSSSTSSSWMSAPSTSLQSPRDPEIGTSTKKPRID